MDALFREVLLLEEVLRIAQHWPICAALRLRFGPCFRNSHPKHNGHVAWLKSAAHYRGGMHSLKRVKSNYASRLSKLIPHFESRSGAGLLSNPRALLSQSLRNIVLYRVSKQGRSFGRYYKVLFLVPSVRGEFASSAGTFGRAFGGIPRPFETINYGCRTVSFKKVTLSFGRGIDVQRAINLRGQERCAQNENAGQKKLGCNFHVDLPLDGHAS